MQGFRRVADHDRQPVAALQLELLRGAGAQEDALRLQEIDNAARHIADERRLQCGRAKRIQTEHLERIAVPRQRDLELEHRTCQIHGWIARERNKEVLANPRAGPAPRCRARRPAVSPRR